MGLYWTGPVTPSKDIRSILSLMRSGFVFPAARIALNSVSSKPIRARKTERYLKGKTISHPTVREAVRLLLKESTPLSMVGVSALVRGHTIEAVFVDLIDMITDGITALRDQLP